MPDAVDHDTLAAVRRHWQEDATLPGLVDRPPAAGTLKSPEGNRLQLPYAHLASKLEKSDLMTGGVRLDHRRVTITLWGTEAQVSAAVAAVRSRFKGTTRLTYPSGARAVGWRPLDDGTVEREPAQRDGLDIWKGTVSGIALSSRTD